MSQTTLFLKEKSTGNLIEILDVQSLIDPNQANIPGQVQAGQEEQDPQSFDKGHLSFPSGEDLPRCWLDADYKNR